MGWNEENLKKIYNDDKIPEIKFTVERILTVEDLDDILTTAVESGREGIGYWAVLDNTTESWEKAKKQIKDSGADCYFGTIITKILLNGDSIRLYDAEADEEDLQEDEIWYLDMNKFKEGCKIYEKERGSLVKSLEDGGFDAIEADCLIQYSVFGKLIFG